MVFTILYGRWTGPRVSQQGNFAVAEKTRTWTSYVGISTLIINIYSSFFLPPNLNAERDAPNFPRKACLGPKLHLSSFCASKIGKEKPKQERWVERESRS